MFHSPLSCFSYFLDLSEGRGQGVPKPIQARDLLILAFLRLIFVLHSLALKTNPAFIVLKPIASPLVVARYTLKGQPVDGSPSSGSDVQTYSGQQRAVLIPIQQL